MSTTLRDLFWRSIELRKQYAPPVKGLRRKGANWVSSGGSRQLKHLRVRSRVLCTGCYLEADFEFITSNIDLLVGSNSDTITKEYRSDPSGSLSCR
jgi:hypothetical protein